VLLREFEECPDLLPVELLERAGLLLLLPFALKDPVTPALKSMEMELVGDDVRPFIKEVVGLLGNWKEDVELLLWKGLILAVVVVGVVTELLLDFV
jgi:hypothetical protein